MGRLVCALLLATLSACTVSSPSPEAVTAAPEASKGGENVGQTGATLAATAAPSAAPAAPFTGIACGEEVVKPAAARDEAKRGCLLDAWQAGKAARLSLRVSTIEGDPMVYVLEALGPARLRVTRDTSQDRFGPRAVTTFVCASLERELGEGGEKRGFVAKGCEGGDGESVRVP